MKTKIVVVLSNPSNKSNGPTLKTLRKWLDHLDLSIVSFANVSTIRTLDNKPLKKSEFELPQLYAQINDYDKIITFGNTARDAVNLLGLDHFNMPHPSPLNHKLNNTRFVLEQLEDCYGFIKDQTFRSKSIRA